MLMAEAVQLPSSLSLNHDGWKSEDVQESTRSYIRKAKKAAQYIHIMKHAQVCNGACKRDICKTTSTLLAHSLECQTPNCPISGCSATLSLFNHCGECKVRRSLTRGSEGLLPCLICAFSSVLDSSECKPVLVKRKEEFEVPLLPKRFRTKRSVNSDAVIEEKER